MFRLSKRIEYAILALQYMAEHTSDKVTAKQMSEHLNISFEFLSKTLQSLMKNGLIASQQGIGGGYMLARQPDNITVTDIIRTLENKVSIVDCLAEEDGYICDRMDNCTIKDPMNMIQVKIEEIFAQTTVAELARSEIRT